MKRTPLLTLATDGVLGCGARQLVILSAVCATLGIASCSEETVSPSPAKDDAGDTTVDASSVDALDAGEDKAKGCVSTFGNELTDAYGRMDGTLVAIVPPKHPTCAQPNGDHVVVELEMNGAVYRAVANVLSTKGAPDVLFGKTQHALFGPAFSEGWHTGLTFDYVDDLAIHKDAPILAAYEMDVLTSRLNSELTIGSHISVYSTSSGGASSHLIHRNKQGADGAIVVNPDGPSPTFLLFAFQDQTF